jgi:phage terminase small subunit
MPRRTAESRSAAYLRSGSKPPAAPDSLSPEAKRIWKKIANTRPHDFFDAAAQVLLAQFCELSATQASNFGMLRRAPTREQWQRQARQMQAVLNSCAVKLRLAPSSVLSKKRAILSETEVDVEDSDGNVLLFGGGGPVRY